jgi:glycerol-3-phosphate acyltransferase PlsX
MIKKRDRSDEYFDKFNYELYGGTPILGVNANVMIAHGKSTPLAFKNMLLLSKDIVEANLNEKIKIVFQ